MHGCCRACGVLAPLRRLPFFPTPSGHLHFKLLAVDVPSVAGGEQRIFLEGGPSLYERGGVLQVLRDPFVRVGRQGGGGARMHRQAPRLCRTRRSLPTASATACSA